MTENLPFLGYGLGLRKDHYLTIIEEKPAIDWFEIITENYLVEGGKPLYYLDTIRADYPMVMHGVSLSIGSADALKMTYLAKVKALAERVQPAWVSDHLCWTGVGGINLHDLLPLPYTEEALKHVVERVKIVQDFLGRQILLENVSSYITYGHSTMPEWQFLAEVAEQADCLILLDINNIYVSAYNHCFDPKTYIQHIPVKRVQQFHLAGHLNLDHIIIDSHGDSVIDPVWSLYEFALRRFGAVSTMIERDDNIPSLEELLVELTRTRTIAQALELAA
ncbi:MAG: hypothetical protein CTY18_11070 [Methylomonas sp.]|nr:MAG: hypothetical protein CTY18_11070 [Methylomonas sp.]